MLGVFIPILAQAEQSYDLSRVSGANRYETASEISKEFFSAGAEEVVIASGEGFADALAAGPLAGALERPILLVQRDSIPASILGEINRLKPKKSW